MKALSIIVVLLSAIAVAQAEETAPSRIDSITKSARDMMPAMPSLPSVSLPSMPDLSLPDFSDTALITSAATAKRIQSTMKLGTAYLDVDFAVPPRVNMKFVSLKANEKEELPRDTDDLEISCK